jgi:sterol desaturase/sphingolipid hydroxylase (fatty acid hydroxylase superfamily)
VVHFLIAHFQPIHIYEMAGLVFLLSLMECVMPRKSAADTLRLRWFGHFSILLLGMFISGLAIPMFGYGWASYCAERGWGLLHYLTLPGWINVFISFLAFDLVLFVRHWLDHHSSLLWRLHRLHHTDDDVDVTTTLRFHPIDMILTVSLDASLTAVLGVPPLAVVTYRLISTVVAYTSHANVKLPVGFERFLQNIVSTPSWHRTHHSVRLEESMTNYGGTLTLWDRLFGTYLSGPEGGPDKLQFGVSEFTERKHQSLHWMLAQPFLSQSTIVPPEDPAITFSRDIKSA